MITAELYRQGRPTVIVERGEDTNSGAWARLQEALARGIESGSQNQTVVHADVFLAELNVLRELKTVFGERFEPGPTLSDQLRSMASDRKKREAVVDAGEPDSASLESLAEQLRASGFTRTLKEFQLRNLHRLMSLPHGADFSVPGAGKTTVALAGFSLHRAVGTIRRLAVIGPIAAFGAWKEEFVACFEVAPKFVIHTGPGTIIPQDTAVLLSNYNRTANDYETVRAFVAADATQVILDEAHRVKRGASGVHGRAVLDLAYAAQRRDVLTGTPAPQGANDLVALVSFLYPGQDRQILPDAAYFERLGRDEQVLIDTNKAVRRYFVRTPKTALELPETKFEVVREPMRPIQSAIYQALVGEYRSSFVLPDRGRYEMQRLGRIVMYLLEAATNPMLLTAGSDSGDDPAFLHPPIELHGGEPLADLLARYGSFELPWKYQRVEQIIGTAATRGQKVLVWSSFVRNLKALARRVDRYQPAIVHGGVPSDDMAAEDEVSREKEFDRFRYDPNCTVLFANPAACGEGVSLHHWCHHAVYLDRTFNAGHFLQSQDRIHRLGLAQDVVTRFTLLISAGSIDDTVDGRLVDKVEALARLMDDPGLVRIALPASDEGSGGTPAFQDDLSAVNAHLASNDARPS
ncbi:DEAD/DEAH box helicase (plasmid) [Rhizobium ruizarguesonis]|uniref:DEAD/DEAH box helicase n=1 Tax=Rhizobium ruizarguesonis TaxID=2081791 RepID=UPI0010321DCC|nr:DEAD/DEAH box helicase [Rhizobium ruizarguesonis]TAU43617.1 DEAD/DEAH box helicase [Rhizobium ruizarguesonis]TAU56616.1 DEAD/DEAH box helicase [Rhizobium ruizarguesonis]